MFENQSYLENVIRTEVKLLVVNWQNRGLRVLCVCSSYLIGASPAVDRQPPWVYHARVALGRGGRLEPGKGLGNISRRHLKETHEHDYASRLGNS